jgi:hypothetical protein
MRAIRARAAAPPTPTGKNPTIPKGDFSTTFYANGG